jgi:hypothetical protein
MTMIGYIAGEWLGAWAWSFIGHLRTDGLYLYLRALVNLELVSAASDCFEGFPVMFVGGLCFCGPVPSAMIPKIF